jgi:hypothetical protein
VFLENIILKLRLYAKKRKLWKSVEEQILPVNEETVDRPWVTPSGLPAHDNTRVVQPPAESVEGQELSGFQCAVPDGQPEGEGN